MRMSRKPFVWTAAFLASAMALTACSSSSDSTSGETSSPQASTSAMAPEIDVAAFTADFAEMAKLTDVAAQGEGLIQVLLPDTTTSTRYVQYDAPYLKQAFEAAGLTEGTDFKIDNAGGDVQTMQTTADAAIAAGASVLLVDPLDTGSGVAIEQKAVEAGAAVIDYDRLVVGGPADRYYVSFDNVVVGELIGQGMIDCVEGWGVTDPNILVMAGDPKDNNAKLFKEGYMSKLQPLFDDGTYVNAGEPAGTWVPADAATTFEQQYTADENINAVVTPNDDNANAVIAVLKKNKIGEMTFPTTGQDASLPGLQNILTGFQCGTVYKPIYLEAQAAAALALYLRAGLEPPASLVNATTADSELNADIPSALAVPIWVTSDNMNATVVTDGAVTVEDLCAGDVADACTAAGIS
jgi:D-xylose transport system substrate-binding protein